MRLHLLALGLVACGSGVDADADPRDGDADGDADSDADSDTDSDTDSDADSDADADTDADADSGPTADTGASISASCAVQPDNALRVDCDVTVSPPGPVSVTFAPVAGGPPRRMAFPEVAGSRRVTLYRMLGQTDYGYAFSADDTGAQDAGTFTSGAVPAVAQVTWSVTGSIPAADDVLFQMGCGAPTAVILDPDGRVVWYQELAAGMAGNHKVQGTIAAQDGGVASILDNGVVRWFGFDGSLRVDARRGVTPGFDKVVHHDLFERDGRIWVLTASLWVDGTVDYVVDGFYVVDASSAIVGEWSLLQIVTPSGGSAFGTPGYWSSQFPGADDYSHANGLFVDAAYDVLVSFYALDTIVSVHGDPAGPGFGDLAAVIAGNGRSPWPSDFTLTDPNGLTRDLTFARQHHPSWLPSGELQMFDNEELGVSRILRLAPDPTTGVAPVTGSWPVGAVCPFEGSAYVRSDGNLLATCAASSQLIEVAPATGDVLGSLRPRCASGAPSQAILARGIPVTL